MSAIAANSAEAYSRHGKRLKESGRLDEAAACYHQALAIQPDCAEVYGDLGNVFKEQGKIDKAIASYRRALALDPDYAKVYINLGVILQEGGLLADAAVHYQRALAIQPDYVAAHFNLGALHLSLGQTEEALHSFRQAATYQPDLAPAAHMIAVLEGVTPQSAPHEFVRNLFDHYAPNFENHLLNKLGYNTPQVIFQKCAKLLRMDNRSIQHALDLGCGTGLTGALFSGMADRLSGVDLSTKMLHLARQKNVYQHLHQADIVTFLKQSDELYDLFLATDVFVYVGELRTVFALIRDRSLPGSYFAFSTERTEENGFVLQQSARYAHSRDYIKSLCQHFDFQIALCEGVDLRKDHDAWLQGDIYIVKLPTRWQ